MDDVATLNVISTVLLLPLLYLIIAIVIVDPDMPRILTKNDFSHNADK